MYQFEISSKQEMQFNIDTMRAMLMTLPPATCHDFSKRPTSLKLLLLRLRGIKVELCVSWPGKWQCEKEYQKS